MKKWLSLEELPEERIERAEMRREAVAEAPRRRGHVYWLVPTLAFFTIGALMFAGFRLHYEGRLLLKPTSQVGHIVRAYGVVKKTVVSYVNTAGPWWTNPRESWNRLEASKSLLVPLRRGDLLQTGEESSAEILFFGGNLLRLHPGTVALFDADGEEVTLRLVMGSAELELIDKTIAGRRLVFRDAEGRLRPIPDDRRVVLSINAAKALSDAGTITLSLLPIERLGQDGNPGLDLATKPLIVRPIDAMGRMPGSQRRRQDRIPVPRPIAPTNEMLVDIELETGVVFRWRPVKGQEDDPVISYEVVVRPAPGGFEVEDTARKPRVFEERLTEFPIEKVDGGGTFLWSVRAVTASGERGPASTPRWLEIKFPERLRAPQIIQPLVK